MAKKNGTAAFWLALLAIAAVSAALWLGLAVSPVGAAGGAIVVIVHSANPVDNLTISDLKKLYLSDRTRWETGKAVAPVMLVAGAPERTAFLKTVCGMNDSDFSNYFMQAAFTGKSATPPKEVTSVGALKTFVADTPGAIGFLKAGDFQGNETGIKAVKIDGAAATEAAYKLKM